MTTNATLTRKDQRFFRSEWMRAETPVVGCIE